MKNVIQVVSLVVLFASRSVCAADFVSEQHRQAAEPLKQACLKTLDENRQFVRSAGDVAKEYTQKYLDLLPPEVRTKLPELRKKIQAAEAEVRRREQDYEQTIKGYEDLLAGMKHSDWDRLRIESERPLVLQAKRKRIEEEKRQLERTRNEMEIMVYDLENGKGPGGLEFKDQWSDLWIQAQNKGFGLSLRRTEFTVNFITDEKPAFGYVVAEYAHGEGDVLIYMTGLQDRGLSQEEAAWKGLDAACRAILPRPAHGEEYRVAVAATADASKTLHKTIRALSGSTKTGEKLTYSGESISERAQSSKFAQRASDVESGQGDSSRTNAGTIE